MFVCWGHAMCTPTRIAGREAVFEFLPENLPFIYIDNDSVMAKTVNGFKTKLERGRAKKMGLFLD